MSQSDDEFESMDRAESLAEDNIRVNVVDEGPLCQDSFRLLKTKTRRGERNQESWGDPATRQS